MFHSKIHRATVTASELDYNGSFGVDSALLKKAGMLPGQQVDVLNVNNGERFTTYLIEEPAGSKAFGVYGAAAHRAKVGDIVILITYVHMNLDEAKAYKPITLVMNEKNEIEAQL
jgi:aspartate 1-decarboxylase